MIIVILYLGAWGSSGPSAGAGPGSAPRPQINHSTRLVRGWMPHPEFIPQASPGAGLPTRLTPGLVRYAPAPAAESARPPRRARGRGETEWEVCVHAPD